jgi:hypothetical protein
MAKRKKQPENWHLMSLKEKENFLMNQSTGVCNCTPSIGEFCELCKDLYEDDPEQETILVTRKELRTFMDDISEGKMVWSNTTYRLISFLGTDPTDGI